MNENQAKTAISLNKIRTIMKSSADVGSITSEAIQLVSKSTELFIAELASKSHKKRLKKDKIKILDYKSLAEYVQDESKLEFLQQMVPKKVTVKEYRQLLKKRKEEEVQEISDDDEDDDDLSVCSSDSGNADDAISISSASVQEVQEVKN